MKRKLLTILLSLVAVFACAIGLAACGDGYGWDYDKDGDWYDDSSFEVVDGFRYYKGRDVKGNTIYAVYEDGASKDNSTIVIPSSYDGKPVTIFCGFKTAENKNITTNVVMSDSVTSIREWAFNNCKLRSIIIGKGLTRIGDRTFYDCRSLTSIVIPSTVKSIGGKAFYNCSNLTSVIIDNGVTSIGEEAFRGCSGLKSIKIPNSVNSIGYGAFYNCSSLTSIEIPDSVKYIGHNEFINCYHRDFTIYCEAASKSSGWDSNWNSSNYPVIWDCKNIDGTIYSLSGGVATVALCKNVSSNIEIPSSVIYNNKTYSVTVIGSGAFRNCRSMTSIEIPDSVTSIGSSAFSGCSSLTSIAIPNSVTSIGSSAFSGCSSLTSIEIPDSVTSIGDNTFYGCSSLTSIAIPNSVTSIGSSAFEDCSSLTHIAIPNSVTSIGNSAFEHCSSLTSVEIPNSVTSMGQNVFSAFHSFTIYCEAASKPSGWPDNWKSYDCPVVWDYKNQ